MCQCRKRGGTVTVYPVRNGENDETDRAAFVPHTPGDNQLASAPFLEPIVTASSDNVLSGPVWRSIQRFCSMGITPVPDSNRAATGPMGPSSYGTRRVASAAEAPGPRRWGEKGAVWRQELARRLRAQREAGTGAVVHSREAEDEEANRGRRQVEILQLEVERLRAELQRTGSLDELPPAYDYPSEEYTH
jgi:hypothetical protein